MTNSKPWFVILGFLDFIEEENDAIKRKHFTDIIRSCGDHLLNLINDIIDLSKIEAGQLELYMESCDLDKLLYEVFQLFGSNPKLQSKSICLKQRIPHESRGIIIKSDQSRLIQILINLLGNALKFTDSGCIEYGYVIKGDVIEFFVKDTGIGIPKDKLDDVFNRFSQVKDKDSTFTQGTGLGLAISKSLVELLGGSIWVISEMNKGAAFYFTIPNVPFAEELPIHSKGAPVEDTKHNLRTKTVLIVEDEELNFDLMNRIMRKEGINSLWAKNGMEAVTMLQSNKTDIILMDIKMPIMNGLEATQKIRELGIKTPIIAQTAYALKGEKEKCIEAGCDDYISKPITKKILLEKISFWLKNG